MPKRQLKVSKVHRKLYVAILAGGTGMRFWPKSREATPKPILSINGTKTLIQQTVARLSPIVPKENIIVITVKGLKSKIKKQLPGISTRNIIEEPSGKDTAAAIGLGATLIARKDPNAIMISMPSDHWVGDDKKYRDALLKAVRAAGEGHLVTIGIKPYYGATGYGYIKVKAPNTIPGAFEVERFVEKPDQRLATRFANSGRYFWNSGTFIWEVSSIMGCLQKYMPKLHHKMTRLSKDMGKIPFDRLLRGAYKGLSKVSIDYGVMEKADDVKMIAGNFLWDDLGSWTSLTNLFPKDRSGNTVVANFLGVNTRDCVIMGNKGHFIGTCGLKDLIVVHTDDATLIARKEKAEDVKLLVKKLKQIRKHKRLL